VIFVNWNGAVYVPEFSALGAMVYRGSGHGTMIPGNFIADLTTLNWSYVNRPLVIHDETGADQYGAYTDGSVFAGHVYQGCHRYPTAWGGGPKGSTISFCIAGTTFKNVGWAMDLNQTNLGYTRICDPFTFAGVDVGAYPSSAMDTTHQGWWVMSYPNSVLTFVSKLGVITQYNSAGIVRNDGAALGKDPVHDLVAMLPAYTTERTLQLFLFDVANAGPSSAWTTVNIVTDGTIANRQTDLPYFGTFASGTPNTNNFGLSGLEWSTLLSCFVLFEDYGRPLAWTLTPPASSPLTNPWTISKVTLQSFDGSVPAAPIPAERNGNWSKFREVPSCRCFVWTTQYNVAPQAFRLPGM